MAQLSNPKILRVDNCMSLQSFPKLPLNLGYIEGFGCSSLETVPDLLRPSSSFEPKLFLSNCTKLTSNQGFIDLFFAVIKNSLQVSLSLSLIVLSIMLCMFQGLSLNYYEEKYDVFPRSEVPKWFSHQCIGDEVNIMEPFSHLSNEWIGIAVCIVFYSLSLHQIHNEPIVFKLRANEKACRYHIDKNMVALSNHIWLSYLLSQQFWEEDRISLWECDANGFCEIRIKIYDTPSSLVKKCGLRVVYKKDIEDLNGNVVQCSNNNIIPYEGLKESLNLWPMVNIMRSQISTRNVVKS